MRSYQPNVACTMQITPSYSLRERALRFHPALHTAVSTRLFFDGAVPAGVLRTPFVVAHLDHVPYRATSRSDGALGNCYTSA